MLEPTLGYAFLGQQNGVPDVQWVKNLPAMQGTQEMWVRSMGQERPLEEEMATHSNILV